jgi:hypothetical protein
LSLGLRFSLPSLGEMNCHSVRYPASRPLPLRFRCPEPKSAAETIPASSRYRHSRDPTLDDVVLHFVGSMLLGSRCPGFFALLVFRMPPGIIVEPGHGAPDIHCSERAQEDINPGGR